MEWNEFFNLTLAMHRMRNNGWTIAFEIGKHDSIIFYHEERGAWHFKDLDGCKDFLKRNI